MKKLQITKGGVAIIVSFLALGSFAAISFASSSITTTQTVANHAGVNDQSATNATTTTAVAAGTNDQTISIATTTAAVPQVKASLTLTVVSVPAATTTSTIGSCIVTYNSATTTDSLNCTSNAATVSLITHATAASVAAALGALTNITATGHGALTATSSGSTATFATAGTETSATTIAYTNGASGAITSSSVTGVVPVAEVATVTFGGTVETGDTYTVFYPASYTAAYTLTASDTTSANIANGVVNTLKALGNYSSIGFTAATSSSSVILTGTSTGAAFNADVLAANRGVTSQVSTITLAGTPEVGDAYSLTIPTFGIVTYTTVASDTSLTNIAMDLNTAVHATTTYASLPFTSAASSASLSLTGKGSTPFYVVSSATNVAPTAQVVTFAIPTPTDNTTYSITINSNTYNFTGSTAASVATGLTSALAADPAVTCSLSGTTITCTAKVPGTSFTYSTNAVDVPVTIFSGGGSSGSSIRTSTVTTSPSTVSTPITTTVVNTGGASSMVSGSSKITGSISLHSHTVSVKLLQQILTADPSLHYTGGVTGYYGAMTMAAVEAFQVKYGVATPGSAGYGTVGPKTHAMMVKVYGA